MESFHKVLGMAMVSIITYNIFTSGEQTVLLESVIDQMSR